VPYLLNVIYLALLLLASPWLLYAAVRHGKYRQGWAEKLGGLVPVRQGSERCLWFHAVSVGEVNLLHSLLKRIASESPATRCVVSTTTRTGFALARQRFPDCEVFYCPLDFSWAVRRAVQRIRPDLLVLVELELWPNLIRAVAAEQIPIAIINGRLSDRSFRGYRRLGRALWPTLQRISLVAAQNKDYAERFRRLGVAEHAVYVTGSIKFDGVQTDRENLWTRQLANLAGVDVGDFVLLCGSTQHPEEQVALDTFRQLIDDWPRLRLIIVPRHPERFETVAGILQGSGLPWQRRSQLGTTASSDARILLVDTVGELSAWWGIADVAFVGGSMGTRGGQNMIEPSAYGALVTFGPRTDNFRDVVKQLLSRDAALVVEDQVALTEVVRRALVDPAWAGSVGEHARQVVLEQQGAVEQTIRLLDQLARGVVGGEDQESAVRRIPDH
jgi:3-deoxy-D-manno-octulosonic-acid transferase